MSDSDYDILDVWVEYDVFAEIAEMQSFEDSLLEMSFINKLRAGCVEFISAAILDELSDEDYSKVQDGYKIALEKQPGFDYDAFLLSACWDLLYVRTIVQKRITSYLTKLLIL